MNPAQIVSIGTAVPENKVSQDQHFNYVIASSQFDATENARLQKIYKSGGIDFRYTVIEDFVKENKPVLSTSERMELYKKHALKLSLQAVDDCLKTLPAFNTKSITHLISFSCTGMYAPGIDMELIRELELNLNIERTCINFMGCYAAFNAIKIANHIARSQPDAVILVVGTEICSIHNKISKETDQLIANAIFGDGASAVLIMNAHVNKFTGIRLGLNAFYTEFSPSTHDMVWEIGDFGFNLKLSAYVPVIIENGIGELTEKLLNNTELVEENTLLYAIHPGGTAILNACEKALKITKEQNEISYKVLREYGNMSSVTVLFVLKEYMQTLTGKDKGKKILSCAFGPGVTMESMLLEVV